MSSHWRSSRWSSAREREERERAKAEEKEQARKGASGTSRTRKQADPTPEPAANTELSDLISSTRSKPRTRKWPYPEEAQPAEPEPEPEPAKPAPRRRSRKPKAEAAAGTGGPQLPNLPDEPTASNGGGGGNVPNRPLIFGLILFLLMGFIVINPGGIIPGIGDDDDDPTPTQQSMILPTAVNTQASDAPGGEATRASDQAGTEGATREEVICIDAGHGGWDTGRVREATDRAPFMEEADLNLAMSYMLKERLEAEGFTVVLTRPSAAAVNIFNQDVNGDGRVASDVTRGSDDQDGNRDELQARINICNEAGADILLSLHINGFDDESARGYEIYYTAERPFGQNNADLAYYVSTNLVTAMESVDSGMENRGYKPDSEMGNSSMHEGRSEEHFVMTGPGVNAADFTITPSEMPGIICEAGFITNDADAAFLADPDNQKLIIDAYADGILEYFDRYPGTFPR